MQICTESAIKGNENKRYMLVHLYDVWGLRRDRLNLRAEKNSFEGKEDMRPIIVRIALQKEQQIHYTPTSWLRNYPVKKPSTQIS